MNGFGGKVTAMTVETPQGPNCVSTSSPYTSNNQVNGWSYDVAGNLTGIPASGGTLVRVACDSGLPSGGMLRAVCYDAENRMTSATTATGSTSTYTYDGDGRRVQKITPSGTTVFVYDPFGNLAQEYGAPSDTGTKYLTTDALGSTRIVTTSTAALDKSYDYLPFGEEIRSTYAGRGSTFPASPYPTTPTGTSLKFTSTERDSETGLDWFASRYMSSAQGRFTSPDDFLNDTAVQNPQSWNLYSYARNNPLRYTDPDGQAVQVCTNDENGKQSCVTMSDPDYDKARRGNNPGIVAPDLSGANKLLGSGAITCGGKVCGSATYQEEGMVDISGGIYLGAQAARGISTGLVTVGGSLGRVLLKQAESSTAKAAPDLVNLSPKIIKDMAKRGWTKAEMEEAIKVGKQEAATDLTAGGASATRYVNPTTGKALTVNDATGKVIQVGGAGFKY